MTYTCIYFKVHICWHWARCDRWSHCPFSFTSTQNVRQKKILTLTDWPHCFILWHEMVKKQSRHILRRLDWKGEKQLTVRNKQQKTRQSRTDSKTAVNVGLFGIVASWIMQLESDPNMLLYSNSFFCFAVKNMNPSCRPPRGYIVKSTWRKYQTLSNIIKLIINWKICLHFGSGTFVCFKIISHRLVVFTKSREDFLSYITWKICRVFILNTEISVIYKARFSVVGDHMLHTRWKLKGHSQLWVSADLDAGGGGTAIYGLYGYVPLWRVWFSSNLL